MPGLQYVILRHQDVAEPHYDLMFETLPGSGLATWRSPYWPITSTVPVQRLKEHRRLFLDFQGELSAHRGRVYQIARGECAVEVGESAVWTVQLLTGAPPAKLIFRQVQAEHWEVEPG